MTEFEPPRNRRAVYGMVHLRALPGTPFYEPDSFDETLRRAVESARALDQGGADGCLVQTVDGAYPTGQQSDPARIAALSLILDAVRMRTDPAFEVGLQIMQNDLISSLALVKVVGADFVRATAMVGATLTQHGWVEAEPLRVAEYRTKLGAADVRMIAEVDTMHFRWFGGERDAGAVAAAARQVGANALAVSHADADTALELIATVREAVPDMPLLLAGGTDHGNACRLLAEADGAFVGGCLERGGWGGSVDAERVRSYVQLVNSLR
ncbi:BtpA/SgcQ family protein [Saccharopolyspora sp. SCSIO 74807]|uniref:BtpA/SgcQ family protein n=1 Tax=Saccharopolyspora sp. SCSIO 74807 TaxID=3118084 RepID=UPI0030CB4CAF